MEGAKLPYQCLTMAGWCSMCLSNLHVTWSLMLLQLSVLRSHVTARNGGLHHSICPFQKWWRPATDRQTQLSSPLSSSDSASDSNAAKERRCWTSCASCVASAASSSFVLAAIVRCWSARSVPSLGVNARRRLAWNSPSNRSPVSVSSR